MTEINFSLLQPVDVGALTQQGFSTGMAMVKHVQTKNALRDYLANPDDPQAYNALAAYDPSAAATIQTQQLQRRKYALETAQLNARKTAGTQAAGGDVQGGMATALSAGDTDFADALSKLDDDHVKRVHDGWATAATLAYRMKGLSSNAERQAYWQQNRPVLESQGVPHEVLDKIDPTNIAQLDGIVAQAQKVTEQIAADRPQVIPTQPGGGAIAYSNGKVTNLVVPNAGDHSFGAPAASGGPDPAPTADRPPPPDMHSVAALGASFGTVTSTTRSPQHNRDVGGGSNSYHLTGHAIDIVPKPGVSLDQVVQGFEHAGYHVLEKLNEGDHLHIAVSGGAAPAQSEAAVRAAAEKAISLGADPAKVRARAAAQGVRL
jgi:hypothetical protein